MSAFIRNGGTPQVSFNGTPIAVDSINISYADDTLGTSMGYTPLNATSTGTSLATTYTIDLRSFSASAQAVSTAFQQMGNAIKTSFQTPGPVLGPPSGFNRYVNGSDLLEEFIRFLGTEGVRQGDLMNLPIELFIKWLIIRACEEDHIEPEVVLELPAPSPQPRCLGCQRFMPRIVQLPVHDGRCADLYLARQLQAA